ncbi:RTA1 like protein-domain-containing protein [Truncatella angustata]|uniref:RTA1 like protein-domain-containing protein n=1 Tax=Truncatella angustata TaxID=152316 RepID=A0A9P8UMI4_9PEZI|nr:RTA1 like protein-domain-containing protein [Truncatella angustata]KAH6654833.1 RTA1 like protein-domain-containing protein [Truncatella angustata]
MQPDHPPFGPVVNGSMIVVFWEYRPSEPPALAFMALFSMAALGHLVYIFMFRAWFFVPFFLGCIAEVFGYYGRYLSHAQPNVAGPWILQNLLLLSAPPFLAASLYMSLGRIIVALNAAEYIFISPRWLTKLYVLIDIGCIASQLIGSTVTASGDPSSFALSRALLLGGLITQLVALLIFMLFAWRVYHGLKCDLGNGSGISPFSQDPAVHWEKHLLAVMAVTFLILIRSVVRAIEFLQGTDGYVASREIFIYLFDAAFILMVVLIFLIIYPGRLVRDSRRLEHRDGWVKF